jgi:diacylglycerol kinase (ATP)
MDRSPHEATSPDQDTSSASESPYKGRTGLRRLLNALRYSLHGFGSAFRHEDAFRQEALLAAALIPIALVLDVSGPGKAMMIASVLLVLIVELLNSAIEAAVDRISLDKHRLSKRAKDFGSAAVFVSLVNVVVVWTLVLIG